MEAVRYERVGKVAAIWFDDGKVNAFHGGTIAALGEAFDRAEADPEVGAVALLGRPGFFSAGLDLKRLPGLGREALRQVITDYALLMVRLFECQKPTVGVVTGHALAGGCVMLCACDARVGAAGSWKVGLNEVAIGLFLPSFVLELARHVLLPTAYTDALLRGRVYDPEGARAVGYLDEVAPAESACERGLALAAELADLSPMAYRLTKRGLKGAAVARARATIGPEIEEVLSSGLFG